MVKECLVLLNNSVVTVIKYGDIKVQLPTIGKEAKTVFVKFENGRYFVVDGLDETEPKNEIKKEEKETTKKKSTNKTTK